MNLVDRVNRQRSLTEMSRTLRSGRIAANASVLTTTYTYDANGNVTNAGGWSYVWDYLNRMLASGYNNSTTTYAYDATGARVMQTSTTSTTYYPSKYFSLASTTNGGASWATSTNYIWLGDTLLGTIDQKLYNSTATGTAISRYVHPDHLGSTNVVTDASGTIAQLLDYYPYGASRVSSSTFPTNEKRQYIGQFADAQTNLSYLNARYYNSGQGRFLSEVLRFSVRRYSVTFGKLAHELRWDDPTNPRMIWLHRLLVAVLGCFLLLMAFHFFFGTIYTGSASPPVDTILETGN
jgi:RHS repeat-associated protein